jgi:hypothetical protein
MKSKTLAFATLLLVTAFLLMPAIAPQAALASTWNKVNTGGFGSVNNYGAVSMCVFGSYLYIGTGNTTTGCQVWRSSNGVTWNQVNTNGFGAVANSQVDTMCVFGSYLYVGTGPEGMGSAPARVFRSSNGTAWNQVNTDGFGDPNNNGGLSMSVFGSYLYAGTGNGTAGCQVWRSSNGTAWNKVNTNGFGDPNNYDAQSMCVMGSYLYVGVFGATPGCEVWRSPNGTTWNMVNTNGFGDSNNWETVSMSVLGSYLYAGTKNFTTGCQVWRSSNGTTWNKVNTNGFGDANNVWAGSMCVLGSSLYVGTFNTITGCQVWRSSNGTTWDKANTSGFGSAKNYGAASMSVLGSYLYAGTVGPAAAGGCQVWRSGSPYLSSFYFAEGYTGTNFQEYLTLENPNATAATASVIYDYSGVRITKDYSVPATGRTTVNVNSEVGANREVSIQVLSDTANLVAERPMYFNYNGVWTGGSDAVGAKAPNTNWYFAEGNTLPGFDEYITVYNPGDATANLTFHYMVAGVGEKDVSGSVAAVSRATFNTRSQIGSNLNESLYLSSDKPVVAERPMYFNYKGVWTGGSDVVGANSPANTWYFAEGTTRPGFEEWLTLQNPGSTMITVAATYQLGSGQGNPAPKYYVLPAKGRYTVLVNNEIGANKDDSVKLTSTGSFIAERPMYFNYNGLWTGGSDVLGANSPAETWNFAEGTTRTNFQEYLTLQNPNAKTANVTITYYTASGQAIHKSWTVSANSRLTVNVNSDAGANQDISAKVASDQPIIVERPMYFDYNGWTGGHDVVGFVPTPP